MPCDSITTQSVNLANALPELVAKAMEDQGWRITGQRADLVTARKGTSYLDWRKGRGLELEARNYSPETLQAITQAYARQAVAWTAQRSGWTVQQLEPNRLQVTRR